MKDTVEIYSGKWWSDQIKVAEKELDEKWRNSGDKVVDRYLDRRSDSLREGARKYNIFWANVQILKSALYATPPKPTVARQNGDAKDDVARAASLMMERILQIGVSKDASDMHNAFKAATENRLIPGMGQVWLRLDVETEKFDVPAPVDIMGLPTGEPTSAERIVHEDVVCEGVNWRDFIWGAARTWDEVPWVARRIWMKKADFIEKFGPEAYQEAKSASTTGEKLGEILPKGFKKGKIEVFEVWCKDSNKQYYVSHMVTNTLAEEEDPLQLDDFFPCPQPLFATHTTDTLIPRPDFVMCQDQYDELDVLNDRISILTRALRLVGVYDGGNPELKDMLTGSEFRMIGVQNWAMFAEKGGMDSAIDWFPVEQVANVLEKLMIQRQAVISQIYELTSISDIMRGSSNPRETAKAQTLKAQYSSVRLQLTQQDVATFVSHAMRIKAEIVCRHLQPQTIVEMSQIMMTESAPLAEQAVALLKNYRATQYRIEISEESLSLADYNAERELRTEYLTAVGQFLSQAGTITQAQPQAMPYLLRMVQWVTSAFKGSSDIESVLDEAIKMASQPQPPQDDGKAAAEQAKMAAQQQAQAASDMVKERIADKANQTQMEIAKMKTDSTEEIAQLNASTKLLIEQLASEIKQSSEQTAAQLDIYMQQVQLAHDGIAQLADLSAQKEQADNDKEEDSKEEMKKLLEGLQKPRKRTRIPTYDGEGRISKIEDIEGDE